MQRAPGPGLKQQASSFNGPEKILYSVCCTKNDFAQNSEFKRLNFESDRSKSISFSSDDKKTDESTRSLPLSPDPSNAQTLQAEAPGPNNERSELSNDQLERIKQASTCLIVNMDSSTAASCDPIARMSFVREVAGTFVRFGEHYFIATALPIISLGFRDACMKNNTNIKFGPSQISFDVGIDMAFLSLPSQPKQESVAMANKLVDFANEALFYRAKVSNWYTPLSSSPYQEQQSIDTGLKLSFRKYDCIKTTGGETFCVVAGASFSAAHELRGGGVYNHQGMMIGMVIAVDDTDQTVYIIPSEMICRSLQMFQAQSKQSMKTIYSSIVLPPPLRTQTLSDPAQQRYYLGGALSDVSGVLVIQAEFYQSPEDSIHRQGFKPASILREQLLTAITIVQDSGLLRYEILANGCIEHSDYGQVPWSAIFSLHAIKDDISIEVEFYNPKTGSQFTKSFPIKRVGALICTDQQKYEKLPGNDLWVTSTKLSTSGFVSSGQKEPLWRTPMMREHRYPSPHANNKRQIDYNARAQTIIGYPTVCHGESKNFDFYRGGYAFRPPGQAFTTIVSAQGVAPKILYPQGLPVEWDDKAAIDENDNRWSIVQLWSYQKINARNQMNGERFLPLSTGFQTAATGFAVKKNNQCFLVTNYHVAGGVFRIQICLPDGSIYELEAESMKKIVFCNEWDLAVIPIDGPLAEELKPLSLADTSQIGDQNEIIVKGYPGGDGRQLTTLPVTSISMGFEPIIQGNVSTITLCYTIKGVIGGSSGSPILNTKNEVIGVVHQGYTQTEHMQGICVELLQELLSKGVLLSRDTAGVNGDYYPGILPFKLESPLQVSVEQSPPALVENIEAYGLEAGDVIEKIDDHPVTATGEVIYRSLKIPLVEYPCIKLAGAEFNIQIRRGSDEKRISKIVKSFPLLEERKTGFSRYYRGQAPFRTVVLGECMLTEVSGEPSRAINQGIHRFFTETEKRKIQFTWYCNFPPDWNDDPDWKHEDVISLTILRERLGWIVDSINEVEIIDFSDVLKAMKKDCETITLVLKDHAETPVTSTRVQFPRLTDEQLLELADYYHWPRSMVIASGLIMSRTVANDCDVQLEVAPSPFDEICLHGLSG
ncbi:MAG: trypsin-like serine protease [Legionellales bacterium]|nr:trypsin-like serine protease [Legionellales bacterium]